MAIHSRCPGCDQQLKSNLFLKANCRKCGLKLKADNKTKMLLIVGVITFMTLCMTASNYVINNFPRNDDRLVVLASLLAGLVATFLLYYICVIRFLTRYEKE